ncbi:MAG: hypothetical protein WBV06_00315, partial [Acidimicrobiia bacterium]
MAIRVAVVVMTLLALLVIAFIRGNGDAEAMVDPTPAQYAAVAAVIDGLETDAARPIGYDEVVDATSGCTYLEQTAQLFVQDRSAPVAGTCEYG